MKSFTRIAFILFLTFCSVQMAFACCRGEVLNVYPSSEYITENPVFFLEHSKIREQIINHRRIFLKDQAGHIINLKLVPGYGNMNVSKKRNGDDHQNRFVLLKPEKELALNSIVSIVIELRDGFNWSIKGGNRLAAKTWKVKLKSDRENPAFGSMISGKYSGSFGNSSNGHHLRFSMQVKDNNKYILPFPDSFSEDRKLKSPRKQQMLIELTDENGKKIIYPMFDGEFTIYHGDCSSNFNLPTRLKKGETKEYRFEARLMDFSGNISKEVRVVNFKILNKSPKEKRRVLVSSGVYHYINDGRCNPKLGPDKIIVDGTIWKNIGTEKRCNFLDVYFLDSSS